MLKSMLAPPRMEPDRGMVFAFARGMTANGTDNGLNLYKMMYLTNNTPGAMPRMSDPVQICAATVRVYAVRHNYQSVIKTLVAFRANGGKITESMPILLRSVDDTSFFIRVFAAMYFAGGISS